MSTFVIHVRSTYETTVAVEADSQAEAEQMAIEYEDACLEQTDRWAEHLETTYIGDDPSVAVYTLTKDGDGVMHSSEGITYDGQTVEAEE